MRVVCPYVTAANSSVKRGLHPLCEQALARYAPDAEMIDLGTRNDAYRLLLEELWRDGESFLLVEQDIEIHETVIPQLELCQEPWCSWAYAIGWPPAPVGSALGCTRFSARLLAECPRAIVDLPVRGWQQLDSHLYPRLREAGWQPPHAHEPLVTHHHRYPAPGGARCACGEDCDARAAKLSA